MSQLSSPGDVDRPTSYVARWIVPVEGAPIERGCVVVRGESIAAVGPRRIAEGRIVDLGDAVVLPGLVNAHAHLEFSDLTQPLGSPGVGFADWIRAVIAHRRRPGFDAWRAVRLGLDEVLRSGTTTIGEIAAVDPFRWFADPPPSPRPDVTAFVELIGLRVERCSAEERKLAECVAAGRAGPVRPGVSPHAPYTVRPEFVAAAAAASRSHRLPLAMHLAESREELRLLAAGDGPLVELLKDMNAWDSQAIARDSRPQGYLRALTAAHRSLVVHGNYLQADEVALLAEHSDRMSVVYCPRTHAHFQHAPHPLPQLLAAGATVCLGTDGRCTNPDLDLRAELREVAERHPQISPGRIVRLGTLDGARALGTAHESGSLVAGKRADLLVVRGADSSFGPEAAAWAPGARVDRVLVRGRPLFFDD